MEPKAIEEKAQVEALVGNTPWQCRNYGQDDNQMHSSALLSYDHTSFARQGMDRQ